MRRLVALLCLAAACVPPAAAADETNPLGMSFVETPDLRLIWFDPPGLPRAARRAHVHQLARLAAARCSAGSRRSRRRSCSRTSPTTATRGVGVAPRNRLIFDVAPLSHAFETYPGQRAHVLADEPRDGARRDGRHRERARIGAGAASSAARCRRSRDIPESLLYSYLTVPRFTVPRWYLEGSAVFMETWMGGGLGRAQGGYDEMVFRAMVRDDARFYDPLGLESRGMRVDFQVGANAYLYGTRFMTWLAYAYVAREGRRLAAPRRGQPSATTPTSSSRCSACRSTRRGSDWIAFERDVPAPQPRRGAQVSDHAAPNARRPARSARSRALYYDEATRHRSTARSAIRASSSTSARSTRATAAARDLADIKRRDALHGRLARLRPDERHGSSTRTTTSRMRDLMAVDVKTGERAHAARERAHRRDRRSIPSTARCWGVRHDERAGDAGAHPAIRTTTW